MSNRTGYVQTFIAVLPAILFLTSYSGSEDVYYIPDIYSCPVG